MMKIAALAFVIAGVLLCVFGISGLNAHGLDMARILNGEANDHAAWMLIGGIVLLVTGLAGFIPLESTAVLQKPADRLSNRLHHASLRRLDQRKANSNPPRR